MADEEGKQVPRDAASELPDPTAFDLDNLDNLVQRVETQLLGGARRYTRAEIAEQAGLPLDEARDLWRALGFATVTDDDERVFTDADLQALRDVKQLTEVGNLDPDVMHAMTRIIGQTFARLASWQGQVVVDILSADPQLIGDDASGALEVIDRITPLTTELHDYVWRRQLVAYFSRVVSNTGSGLGNEVPMAVGFADMAGFTTFTRQSSDADLRAVLDSFEKLATDVIADNRGQLVKTIGDEVLFTAAGRGRLRHRGTSAG